MSSSSDCKEKTRRRSLSREELELWHRVTRSVDRLPRASAAREHKPPARFGTDHLPGPARAWPAPSPRPRQSGRSAPSPPEPTKIRTPALESFDWRLHKRLARGRASVDDMIDLHGLRQPEAHRALRRFLIAAQSRAAKVVLVVTGKGGGSAASGSWSERAGGVLSRAVPQWLSSPEFRILVAGFEKAGSAHGGAGALYVRLRRSDRPTKPRSPRE